MLVEGLVSTIIPVHNRPLLLREAVASVLAQTYRGRPVLVHRRGQSAVLLETGITSAVLLETGITNERLAPAPYCVDNSRFAASAHADKNDVHALLLLPAFL